MSTHVHRDTVWPACQPHQHLSSKLKKKSRSKLFQKPRPFHACLSEVCSQAEKVCAPRTRRRLDLPPTRKENVQPPVFADGMAIKAVTTAPANRLANKFNYKRKSTASSHPTLSLPPRLQLYKSRSTTTASTSKLLLANSHPPLRHPVHKKKQLKLLFH